MKGCSIILYNDINQILLMLRDDKPGLPYRNRWDLPGGHVEDTESPDQCIVREIKEELHIDLNSYSKNTGRSWSLFNIEPFSDRTEYTYQMAFHEEASTIELSEGQRLRWFTRKEVEATELAYNFNIIVNKFFSR